jgi:hypothetical protein
LKREREGVEEDLHKSKKKNKIDIIRTYRITSELIKILKKCEFHEN